MDKSYRKTKIIATIGPGCAKSTILKKINSTRVDCFRLNTAHGTFDKYKEWIELARSVSEIPFMIDVKGPEIRIRTEGLEVKKEKKYKFYFKEKDPYFSFDFKSDVKVGDKIYFDNGLIQSQVLKINEDNIELEFISDAHIKSNKGVNIPNKSLDIPSLSLKDVEAVKFALENDFSYIALSFVRSKKDIDNLRKIIGKSDIGIIAKIENHEGLENIDEIIDCTDGVMIARGDLGVEIDEERIPIIQKDICKKCNENGKIAIVATQMLESMTENKFPTRAEISDVANAILDGADAVMLSGETAIGKYPNESVEVMNKVALEVENDIKNKVNGNYKGDISEELARAAKELITNTPVTKAVTITRSGFSANMLSKYRMSREILALTDNFETYQKMKLVWGVLPILVKEFPKTTLVTEIAIHLKEKNYLKDKDIVAFFAGIKTKEEKISNLLEIHRIKNLLEYHYKYVLN